MAKLVFNISLPTLVFLTIATTDFHAVLNLYQLLYFVFGTLISFVLIWWLGSIWIKDGRDLGAFIQGAFRGNTAIIVLALAYNLFADEGLA